MSAAVSAQVRTRAMFLLAPAFFMPGYEQYTPVPAACPIAIVHGWNDDVVPVDNSIRFAKLYKSQLHVLDMTWIRPTRAVRVSCGSQTRRDLWVE